MRNELTKDRLSALMQEIARQATADGDPYRVYLVGGGTAVWAGWRESSIDADLFTESEDLFRDVQGMKDRLNVNIEFARPEHFVPPLPGAEDRHVFVERLGAVEFFHYDPYSQAFSKIVRGFDRDLEDARQFVNSGMVDGARLLTLVARVPEAAFSRYPTLSPAAVRDVVASFVEAEV